MLWCLIRLKSSLGWKGMLCFPCRVPWIDFFPLLPPIVFSSVGRLYLVYQGLEVLVVPTGVIVFLVSVVWLFLIQSDLVSCFLMLLWCLFFFPALEFVLGFVGFAEIFVRNKWANHRVLLLWRQILPGGLTTLCGLLRMLCTAALIV